MPLPSERLESKFNEEYARLNDQQRLAVDRIDGPVMVIAGPGTGKTQILATRIGKILLDTDATPDNILCLTYTDAGVVAMRKRLLQFIGPDAYRVNIYTYHAFCNDVIQDNLSLFEKNSLDAISELEKIQLFKDLIDSFQKDNILKRYRGDVYYEIKNLAALFSNMKREGWTPAFINERIDKYMSELPLRDEFIYKKKYKDFSAGDVKKEKVADELEKMDKLRAAVNQFESFQRLMRERDRYDFDDMINWVITAFKDNKALLANYQEQFQYVLVDEYQDTSGTQNTLVSLLIEYWDKPNVFVVGDDDQSIYRFQGANVENMLDFANNYTSDLLTVVLTNNYRSTQPILNISKTLIDRNDERLVKKIEGLTKELLSSNSNISHLEHLPFIKEYETQRHEMIGIALSVQKLVGDGITPGRIGIIYKENKYGETLAQYLKVLGLPVYSKRHLDILQLPLATKIISLLRYLAAEHDIPYSGDELLFEILHFNWFQISPIDIAKLSIEVDSRRNKEQRTSIRQLIADKASLPPQDLFSKPFNEELKLAGQKIESLIAYVPNITLQELFGKIISDAALPKLPNVLSTIMVSANKHEELQVLTGFFDFIKEETHRDPLMNIQQLVNVIELMQKENIPLPLMRVSGSDKGINLMTAHGSKGLEFEYVFFVGCNASSWEKKRKPGGGYSLPDTMFTSNTGTKKTDEEELRRLFYVALTRAEQHLYISYARLKADAKLLEPSMFIAEIQHQHSDLNPLPVEISNEDLSIFSELEFTEARPEIEKIEEDLINRLLEKFVMNVTALNNYLKCPLEFYYKNLIRIPSPKNENTEFGSAVHFAVEKLFSKMESQVNKTFPLLEEFVNDFEWYMQRHRESFTREQFARRMEYGREILANYYNQYVNTFNKIVAIERNISNVQVDGVPIKGKLDKLEFEGKSVNVVDYKSGDPEKGISKMKGPNPKDPNGGDYWRQGVFYKILVDNYPLKDWKVVSTEFDFIEPDKKKKFRKERMVIGQTDITAVKAQIKQVWDKVQAHDFYTGCGKEDCHWCNFVKTNHLEVELHDAETVEEQSLI